MALITSDCDAMRTHEHQMALITSESFRSINTQADLSSQGRMKKLLLAGGNQDEAAAADHKNWKK